MFKMFQLFFRSILQVYVSTVFRRMLQLFYLNVAYVAVATHMLQVFHDAREASADGPHGVCAGGRAGVGAQQAGHGRAAGMEQGAGQQASSHEHPDARASGQ
jgi:phage terminase large subunit-like protein